jgi:hypothetical protein
MVARCTSIAFLSLVPYYIPIYRTLLWFLSFFFLSFPFPCRASEFESLREPTLETPIASRANENTRYRKRTTVGGVGVISPYRDDRESRKLEFEHGVLSHGNVYRFDKRARDAISRLFLDFHYAHAHARAYHSLRTTRSLAALFRQHALSSYRSFPV